MASGYNILLREVNGRYLILSHINLDNSITVYSRGSGVTPPVPPVSGYSFKYAPLDTYASTLVAGWKLNTDGSDVIGTNTLSLTGVTFTKEGIEA